MSTEMAAVSIIIPVFDRLELTRACIDALARHTSPRSCEIIVVDNGSTDGTAEFLREQSAAGRLRLHANSENCGFARACNQGARLARTDGLLFLNNDTEVQAGWLDPLLAVLAVDSEVAAVGCKLLYPDRTIQHAGVLLVDHRPLQDPLLAVHIHQRAAESLPDANRPRIYGALTAACLLVRRAAYRDVQGFDEGYWNGYEDVDLCFKLRQSGGRLVYQPDSVVVHHESKSGPARFERAGQNVQRLHRRWLGRVPVDLIVHEDGRTVPDPRGVIRPWEARKRRANDRGRQVAITAGESSE